MISQNLKFLIHDSILQSGWCYTTSCSQRTKGIENQTHRGMLNYKISWIHRINGTDLEKVRHGELVWGHLRVC
jgi:hypothetical protein